MVECQKVVSPGKVDAQKIKQEKEKIIFIPANSGIFLSLKKPLWRSRSGVKKCAND